MGRHRFKGQGGGSQAEALGRDVSRVIAPVISGPFVSGNPAFRLSPSSWHPTCSVSAKARPQQGGRFRLRQVMQEVSRSGADGELRLDALIADLWWRVRLLNTDILEEEARAGCSMRNSRPIRCSQRTFARDATIWSRRSACSSSVRDRRSRRPESPPHTGNVSDFASLTRSSWRRQPVFSNTCSRWLFTVATDTPSSPEIASRVWPSQISSKIRISAGVKS